MQKELIEYLINAIGDESLFFSCIPGSSIAYNMHERFPLSQEKNADRQKILGDKLFDAQCYIDAATHYKKATILIDKYHAHIHYINCAYYIGCASFCNENQRIDDRRSHLKSALQQDRLAADNLNPLEDIFNYTSNLQTIMGFVHAPTTSNPSLILESNNDCSRLYDNKAIHSRSEFDFIWLYIEHLIIYRGLNLAKCRSWEELLCQISNSIDEVECAIFLHDLSRYYSRKDFILNDMDNACDIHFNDSQGEVAKNILDNCDHKSLLVYINHNLSIIFRTNEELLSCSYFLDYYININQGNNLSHSSKDKEERYSQYIALTDCYGSYHKNYHKYAASLYARAAFATLLHRFDEPNMQIAKHYIARGIDLNADNRLLISMRVIIALLESKDDLNSRQRFIHEWMRDQYYDHILHQILIESE